jgi:DUF4097 and DUF4098 domain-containing protein YvlB
VSPGGTLKLNLEAGGSVKVTGGSGSTVSVAYSSTGKGAGNCAVEFKETADGLEVESRFLRHGKKQQSSIRFDITVPDRFDIEIDSIGGGLEIDGVEGTFQGETLGGGLILRNVRGEARLKTMGGAIELTDSELDGRLETMGGEVRFENVVGDVRGSSMGGNVKYRNVVRRDGTVSSPSKPGLDDVSGETVQISTMGGAIEIEDAPEGASLHTMGGDIKIRNAVRFVDAKTMGGDIRIDSVDGWVKATTMGGDVEVTVTGSGGEVSLVSMSGDIVLNVPTGFGMDLDLEIAYTRNSSQNYRIETDFAFDRSETSEWDHGRGTPRKYIRGTGSVDGGYNKVKIRTVNGNITVRYED